MGGYSYNLRNLVTSVTYPGGTNSVSRGYDYAGRLTSVDDWLSHHNAFQYDADSNLCTVQYGNGVVGQRVYDRADRLSNGTSAAMSYYASGTVSSNCSVSSPGTTLLSLTYPRDALGQVSSETCTSSASAAYPSGGSTSYGYDAFERLNSSAGSTYSMDAADRLTGGPLPGSLSQTLNYDPAGELTTGTAGSASYTFGFNDPSGNHTSNRTSRTDQLGTKLSYSYDQLNRMTGFVASRPGSEMVIRQYTYSVNGDGLRMSKAIDGVSNGGYAWDVTEGLPLLLQEGSTDYVTGPGGLPLEQVNGSSVSYYQPDQLGSTRLLTDPSATVQDAYTYDAYGNLISSQVAQPNPFMFAGQYSDQESGLYYLRARYYDPSAGQFTSRDPLAATTRQPYSYVGDNPLNGTDPTGLDFWGSLQSDIISFGNWASTPTEAPNFAEAYDAQFNVGYGIYKVATGVPVLLAGGTAEVTIPVLGQTGGTLALLYGGYQTVTGTARIIRGCRQAFDLEQHPVVRESPVQQAQGLITGVAPGGQRAEDFLGGLF